MGAATSRVRIAAARPNGESLASRSASASSLNGVTEVKGPNTSSWKMRMSLLTSANTVGSTK